MYENWSTTNNNIDWLVFNANFSYIGAVISTKFKVEYDSNICNVIDSISFWLFRYK